MQIKIQAGFSCYTYNQQSSSVPILYHGTYAIEMYSKEAAWFKQFCLNVS